MEKHFKMTSLALLSLITLLHSKTTWSSVSATEFVYNTDFKSSNIFLCGNSSIQSSILVLSNRSFFSISRAFYPYKIPTKAANSSTPLPFATSFIFSIAPIKHFLTGHGFAFIFSPTRGLNGTTSSQYIGFLNFTNEGNPQNHAFGVEFDVRKNVEFNDINDNHVGIDINSLTSFTSHDAGYWGGENDKEFKRLKLNNGVNYQVWIEFVDSQFNVTMAQAGRKRPKKPLISKKINLSEVFLDQMYVGFCASTGLLMDTTRIMGWSYSNSNFSIGDALITTDLPSFVHQKGFFSGSRAPFIGLVVVCMILIGCVSLGCFILWRGIGKSEEEDLEEWELEYWPHRITYQEIIAATSGFSEEKVIGIGGNGKVYKGVLQGVEVAVKRISHETESGIREFLAEISSLGRLKHRNLVNFRGWCKREKGSFIIVYDYMENGSLDKWIFESEEGRKLLTWEERIQVLKNVASGILYLHEGWEVKVLHRDIKSSNVLLDKDMNARLGDFGLARMHDHHGKIATTTKVIGTIGYIAPEVVKSGRASTQTDVFGFGILVLEVVCGRRPIEEGKPGLPEWLMSLMEIDELHCALDERLKSKGGCDIEEVERMLRLGLLCANSDPNVRPTMRQVVNMLEGEFEGNETEQNSKGENLLEKIKSAAMWSETALAFCNTRHPRFEDLMFSSYSKTSGSNSCAIPDSEIILEEGR
ncbi:probable L-type lectin-domain containing receptor kinase VII.2 [Neltuma alba]|uniref:probable L-type lectin-domain containing receptor kinase VII.2 n=1 Tax=Neltuma alba TaxID=207710 RepID=UPI0010A3E6D9|nr:probable L-type lectin-domain containing receptor kinase VII.2 [Prosopis alba]XP_028807871.1 probable L-type lectin-domain containing receptor kinase VII.2 [Prosopis alba]